MIPIKYIVIGSVLLGMLVVRSAFGDPPANAAKTAGEDENTPDATQSTDALESASPEPPGSSLRPDDSPSEYALTKELLGNLSPENMKSLGEMLEEDWQDRPEWGRDGRRNPEKRLYEAGYRLVEAEYEALRLELAERTL